jgi:hypothetical protein
MLLIIEVIHTAGFYPTPFLAETDSKLCDVFVLFVPQACLVVLFLDFNLTFSGKVF